MRVHARHAALHLFGETLRYAFINEATTVRTTDEHHARIYITNMYIYGNTQLQPHAINGNSNLPQARNDNAMRRRSPNGSKNKWAAR